MPTINDPDSRLDALIDRGEKNLRVIFLAIIQAMREQLDLEELTTLIAANQWNQALETIMAEVDRLGTASSVLFIGAGTDTEAFLRNAGVFGISFDQTNDRAVRAMKLHRLSLIQNFTAAQREATRSALLDGMRRGLNPVTTARAFRDSIGLTPRQQAAVANYRRLLDEGNAEALTRALRDRRFDRTVQRAISGDKPLTPEQVNRMVSRYATRYVDYRSRVVARTQSLRAVHEGNRELFRQAIEQGKVKTVTRTWHAQVGDGRTRMTHEDLNEVSVGFDEPWVTFKGNRLMYPGDPAAPAEEIIQCRCSASSRVTF